MKDLVSREGAVHPQFPALVINWHVTQACNYHCSYCYAQWDAPDRTEVIRDRQETERLVRAVHAGFGYDLRSSGGDAHDCARRLRLNFAGGEPLLFAARVVEAMRVAKTVGMDVSLITNGSRLTRALVSEMAPLLTILGVSLDALDRASNAGIGRADALGRTPDTHALTDLLALARKINPALIIKVNTVVNAKNWDLDLTPLLQAITPHQWKVLRMLPSTTTELAIDREQFSHFLASHAHLADLMRVEDNQDMVESYLMVDPHGRFFQNGRPQGGYSYSAPILEAGAQLAVKTISWSPAKFAARYGTARKEQR